MNQGNYKQAFCTERERWVVLASMITLCMFGMTVIPGRELWNGFSETRSLIPENAQMSILEMRKEIKRIEKELTHYQNGYVDGDTAYRHMNRLFYLSSHAPLFRENDPRHRELLPVITKISQLRFRSAALRHAGSRSVNTAISERFNHLKKSDPGSMMRDERVSSVVTLYHWELIPKQLRQRFPRTVMLAFFFFVCMLMYHGKLLEEIREYFLFRIALASLVWFVAMWFFPSRFLVREARRGLQWLRMTISVGITLIPQLAHAQSKSELPKTKDDEQSLAIGNSARTSGEPRKLTTTTFDFLGDSRHDRQFILRVSYGRFTFFNQNFVTADGKSAFTVASIGPIIQAGKFRLLPTVGPQYTYERGKIDRTVVFMAGSLLTKRLTVKFIDRLSFGHEGEATPFSHRHIQDIRGSPMPGWLSFESEELYTVGKWRQLFVGPKVNVGGLIRRKGFWKGLFVYPYWDGAKGNFDLRIWMNFSFAQ